MYLWFNYNKADSDSERQEIQYYKMIVSIAWNVDYKLNLSLILPKHTAPLKVPAVFNNCSVNIGEQEDMNPFFSGMKMMSNCCQDEPKFSSSQLFEFV